MSDSFIQLPPDSTGKKLQTLEHTVNSTQVHGQVFHISDPVNPDFIQNVDVQGQAFVRFAEGSPNMDAFKNLSIGLPQILGGYEYTNTPMDDLFTDATANGGLVTWNQQASNITLSVTTNATSSVSRTTNRYHYYQPGVGNLIIMTIAHGDVGKANNVRRWGYFDNDDGLFFELDGTTLSVVIRSSTTGSVVETRVNQSAWNGDRLNGSGPSEMTLDLTKANFYFIDFAWLGVGAVRFGALAQNGSRWVCHTFKNPNTHIGAYMRSGALPIKLEMFNTGVPASSSEFKDICNVVYSESKTNYSFWRWSDIERTTPVTVTTNTPILSMRVKPGSRVGIYPESIHIFVSGGNVKISIVDDASLTGATWGITGGGFAEGDNAATAASGGDLFKTFYVPIGISNIDLTPFYETNDEGYHRLADDSDSYTFTLVASKLDGTTVTAVATLGYKELA